MFQKRLNYFFFFLFLFSSVSSSWLEECPERRKSLGRCLAGLCPFEAECIDDHCCEFPKLPMIKPETLEIILNATEMPAIEKATVPMLPFEKLKPDGSAEEEDNKPLTSEEVKQAGTPPTNTTTTTTTRRPRNKKRPLPTTKTTTTTTLIPDISSTEDPLCFDGSYSIGECMDGYCPDGYACENGYCCKCQDLPCGKVLLLTTSAKPTNIFTLTPDSFENSNESSEEKSEEEKDLTTSTPTTTTPTTTKKPKMKKLRATTPTTTTMASTETLTNVSDINIFTECVDGKCPESHEYLVRSCKKHLCNKSQYLSFMTEQCGRTCRRCDKQNQPTDLKPKRPKRCRDSRNDCEEWAAEGFCKSALYSIEQKRHLCGKSCKLC
uniref:ShKT domain-containing protein n=1 Tax=Panagrolaimus sp. PS1159 TaxID=55785 RepID=A0AC35ESQ7_9BILA